jgi:uncharacterized membrane protein YfcA
MTAKLEEREDERLGTRRLAGIGLTGGVLSGLLGVGGGIVIVPLLVASGRVGQRRAHALSLGAIIPISLASILTYGVAGRIDFKLAAALAAGAIVGARVGAGALARASERLLKLIFGVFLVAVAASIVLTAP